MKRIVNSTGLAIGLIIGSAASAFAGDVTVATWGGSYTEKQRTSIFDPYTKASGKTVLDAVYTGGLGQIQAMVDAGNTTWDVIQMGAAATLNACDQGLLEELDTSRLEHLSEFSGIGISDCGIGAIAWGLVLAYNTELTGEQHKSWTDFWDLKTYPGKRAMKREPRSNLEFALLADGVAPEDIYTVLRTEDGLDRAFAKLDEIKDSIQWWEAGAQPPEWLANGNVVMSTSFVGRIVEARSEGASVTFDWPGATYSVDYWAIVAGSKNIDEAYGLLNYATSAEAQAAFSRIQPVAPVNASAAGLLTAERLKLMPAGDNLNDTVPSDESFWIENLEPLTERFNTWVSQ
jgi:putative spermidine/putrescine transport system substrate-binding protein